MVWIGPFDGVMGFSQVGCWVSCSRCLRADELREGMRSSCFSYARPYLDDPFRD